MDEDDVGPAMAELDERQRAFVRHALADPLAPAHSWARAAGYSDAGEGCKVRASILLRRQKIIDALSEETGKRVRLGGWMGIEGLIQIVLQKDHPKRFEACVALADRGGFAAKTEHKVTVEHVNDSRLVELAARFAAEFQLDRRRLLGGNVIEGEAKEIK
jgi:hypothetical protein